MGKKIAAILLLVLFFFNIIGFKVLVDYARDSADATMEARLDQGDYQDADLITLKVPVNLPYQTNWESFERTKGEITIKGTTYTYVKRKLYNDTLILMCIANTEKTEIANKANDYYGKVNGLPLNNENKKADNYKQFSFDKEIHETLHNLLTFSSTQSFSLYYHSSYAYQPEDVCKKPPRVIA